MRTFPQRSRSIPSTGGFGEPGSVWVLTVLTTVVVLVAQFLAISLGLL